MTDCSPLLQWEKGSIRGLGWLGHERLVVVTKDGTVRCYYDLQGEFSQFSLGKVRYAGYHDWSRPAC